MSEGTSGSGAHSTEEKGVANNNASSMKEPTYAKSGGGIYPGPDGKMVEIKDVWASTLDAEMAVIRELVESYPRVPRRPLFGFDAGARARAGLC